jgi:hypothetical protein
VQEMYHWRSLFQLSPFPHKASLFDCGYGEM